MAEKPFSSLVITLDLACCRCFTKIRKALCKLQESEDIRGIFYDEKAGTVTISGPFDPLVVPCKLRRKAGCVIKDICLKMPEQRPPPPRMPEHKPYPEPKPAPPPPPPPKPAAPAWCCCACASPGRLCHCGGCGSRPCCFCVAYTFLPPVAAAAPCYGVPNGGCPKIQFTYDEPAPACSIM